MNADDKAILLIRNDKIKFQIFGFFFVSLFVRFDIFNFSRNKRSFAFFYCFLLKPFSETFNQ